MDNMVHNAMPARQRKGLAIASLILGIVGIPTFGVCFVGGITGIVLGIVALSKAGRNPVEYAGKGLAITGIILCSLSLLIGIPGFIAAIAIPNLLKARQAANEVAALTDVKTIGEAQRLYSLTKGRGKYTDLKTLGAEGLIDAALASGEKGGYSFSSQPVEGSKPMFDTTAIPVKSGSFGTGNRSFGSNETYLIYEAEGARELKGTPKNRAPASGIPTQ